MRPAHKGKVIRELPPDTPPTKVQQLLRARGLGTASVGYIQKVQGQMRAEPRRRPAAPATPATNGHAHADAPEQQLRRLAVTLGVQRCRQLIDQLEAQLLRTDA